MHESITFPKLELQHTTKQNKDHATTIALSPTMHHCRLYGDTGFRDTFFPQKLTAKKLNSETIFFLQRTGSARFFLSLTTVDALSPLLELVFVSCLTEPLVGWAVAHSRSHGFWQATTTDTGAKPPTHKATLLKHLTNLPATHSKTSRSILQNHIRFTS